MITLGIVLLIIGALIAWLVKGDVGRLGYIAAVIGLVLIVVGVLLSVLDDDVDADAILLPLAASRALRLARKG